MRIWDIRLGSSIKIIKSDDLKKGTINSCAFGDKNDLLVSVGGYGVLKLKSGIFYLMSLRLIKYF